MSGLPRSTRWKLLIKKERGSPDLVTTRDWTRSSKMLTNTLPLPNLFRQALSSASKAVNLPTINDDTQVFLFQFFHYMTSPLAQELVQDSLKNLSTLDSRIIGLSLFSPNESLEDISTRDLVYLLVPYVYAEVQGRIRTTDRDQRMVSLNQAQVRRSLILVFFLSDIDIKRHLKKFLGYIENYEVVPEEELALHEKRASTISDPAKRRELKIQQYKKEKELKTRIEVCADCILLVTPDVQSFLSQVIRKRRRQLPVDAGELTDFDLIASLLPNPSLNSQQSPTDDDADEEDSETDDILRETTLLLLRLTYAQAHSHLESMDQELQLLHSMPPPPSSRNAPPADHKRGKSRETDDMWKLDAPTTKKGGPLLDSDGKVRMNISFWFIISYIHFTRTAPPTVHHPALFSHRRPCTPTITSIRTWSSITNNDRRRIPAD